MGWRKGERTEGKGRSEGSGREGKMKGRRGQGNSREEQGNERRGKGSSCEAEKHCKL